MAPTSTTTQPGDTTTTTTSTSSTTSTSTSTSSTTSTSTSTTSTSTSTTTTTTTAAPQCTYDGLTIVCDGTTTTTSTSTSTTTTTTSGGGTNYIAYYADKYACDPPNCGAFDSSVQIAFPDTFTPVLNKWYSALTPDGFAYQLTSTTPSAGPGLICYVQSFNSCGLACSI